MGPNEKWVPAVATQDSPDKVCTKQNHIIELKQISQAQIERSPAVAAALQRARARLLAIKRISVWRLANMAGAEHDALMEALENTDDDAILDHGKLFIEDVRGFAKLLGDFRDTREARQ